VGFVDIVDSTALFQWLPLASVGSTMARFVGIAADVVTRSGGRVVKFSGDDVMFSAPQPADACRIALDLVAAFDGDEVLAGVRGGLAHGEVLVRDADCFGAVVNLAARATKAASPGEVLVDEGVRAAVADSAPDLVFGSAQSVDLPGFDDHVVLRNVRQT
jgi:adenylate cyclase